MQIDYYKIRKKIDVMQLKKSFKDYIVPKVTVEEKPTIKMSNVLLHMYCTGEIDQRNVSVNSSFICMLHLANEEQLLLNDDDEMDFTVKLDEEEN